MQDLSISLGDFAATTADVSANTAAGRVFLGDVLGTCAGVAPVSATIAKSQVGAFIARARKDELSVG